MKFPKPDPAVAELFHRLVAKRGELEVRKMFGHPCTFRNGNMCIGTFGAEIFLRLGEADRKTASKLPGVRPFVPMPGRPMREYLVFPTSILDDPRAAARWIGRSVRFVGTLPPK